MNKRIALVAAAAAAGMIVSAPVAAAAPGHCANHGTGHGKIYKAGCAGGSGGAGRMFRWTSGPADAPNGTLHRRDGSHSHPGMSGHPPSES